MIIVEKKHGYTVILSVEECNEAQREIEELPALPWWYEQSRAKETADRLVDAHEQCRFRDLWPEASTLW